MHRTYNIKKNMYQDMYLPQLLDASADFLVDCRYISHLANVTFEEEVS